MIFTGEVITSEVQSDPDGDGQILILQVQVTDPDDIQTFELMRHAGVDYNPVVDSTVAAVEISPSYRIAVACDDGVTPEANPGEYEIYSSDGDGNKRARVKCVGDGQLELNGTGDFAVAFNELKTAFDELQAKHNALSAAYVTHTHTSFGAPPTAITPDPGLPNPFESTADIDTAKVNTVRLP